MRPELACAIEKLEGTTVSLQDPLSIPDAGGIYAWWMVGTPLTCAPATPHPSEGNLSLVYIGIAPRNPLKRSTLRSRIVRNHLKGNIAASTLRLSLASLLVKELSLVPEKRGTK